jgi:molybdate transport system permease protein
MKQDLFSILAPTLLWAFLATWISCFLALPLAYVLARKDFPGKQILATLASLPLVLPPTAVGYLLVQLLADDGWLGRDRLGFDVGLLLSWKGVVLACTVMSLPLVVRTARVAFEQVDPDLETMARTLGKGPLETFLNVTLPLASKGLIAAFILGFTRALGEFGATVMVAGNIPGQTQTLAAAIYSAQQAGNVALAHSLLWVALSVGFAAVFLTEWLTREPRNRQPLSP